MRRYQYNFLDSNGHLGALLYLASPSDDAACDLASELLTKSDFIRVEVRNGTKVIFQITRVPERPSGPGAMPPLAA